MLQQVLSHNLSFLLFTVVLCVYGLEQSVLFKPHNLNTLYSQGVLGVIIVKVGSWLESWWKMIYIGTTSFTGWMFNIVSYCRSFFYNYLQWYICRLQELDFLRGVGPLRSWHLLTVGFSGFNLSGPGWDSWAWDQNLSATWCWFWRGWGVQGADQSS